MAQIGAVFVFCSSCKILCFASSVHPKNATELMPRGSPCEAPFWPDFIRGCTPTNDIFWSKSFLTPLIAWKTPTNIGKQLCIYQSPTRGPKSTKMELLDQILALWSDLEHCANGLKINIFAFFQISSTFWQPVALETFENNSAHENTFLGTLEVPYLVSWNRL